MKKLIKLRNNTIIILVVIGILAIGSALLYATSLIFNPLLLLLILPVWILYSIVKRHIIRSYSLKRNGYFGGGYKQGECKYEEYVMGKLMDLRIKLENTEPGHWELFVPTESQWRSIAPSWAIDRRIEIIERITPYFKSSDVHYPDDYKKYHRIDSVIGADKKHP